MMAPWKDWAPGECRLKLELVTPTGSCAKFYLSQVPKEFEQRIYDLINEIIVSPVKRESNDD